MYVKNEEFVPALIERKMIISTLSVTDEKPPVSNYIGKCIYDICNNLAFMPKFINYSYRNEMVGDAIESCLKAVDNFDVEKSANPFGYFTQIAFYAFLNRIDKEKKEAYIRAKVLEMAPMDELFNSNDDTITEDGVQFIDSIRDNYYFDTKLWEDKKKAKNKKKPKAMGLEQFMGV
jgi:hypothetical protein